MVFGSNYRVNVLKKPSLICNRNIDKFTVSNSIGNGNLTYPVGLITVDEAIYAGQKYYSSNTSNYLYTNREYYTLSPSKYDTVSTGGSGAHTFYMRGSYADFYDYYNVYKGYGVRPVISLSPNTMVSRGNGTSINPYVISTN